MPRRRLPCKPGDWFSIPLDDGGMAVGMLARKGHGSICFGYFFGPRRDHPPSRSALNHLRPDDAVLVCMFGALGLLDGRWTVLGPLPGWSKDAWPLPDFGRIDDPPGARAWRARYAEEDLRMIANDEVTIAEARQLPRDSLFGTGAVEIALSVLLEATNCTDCLSRCRTGDTSTHSARVR